MTKSSQQKQKKVQESDIPSIQTSNEFFRNVSVIFGTSMSTMVGIGKVHETDVLMPIVDFTMSGADDLENRDPVRLFSKLLTLENAAFLAMDVTAELSRALEQLSGLSNGRVKLESNRANEISKYLDRSETLISQCRSLMSKIQAEQ